MSRKATVGSLLPTIQKSHYLASYLHTMANILFNLPVANSNLNKTVDAQLIPFKPLASLHLSPHHL